MQPGSSCLVLLCALFGAGACNGNERSCTLQADFGFVITVQAGGATSCHANVTVRDGDYEEVFPVTSDAQCFYRGADERTGTYTITVTQPGFVAASTTAIVPLDDSGCHVVPQIVTIALEPEDGGS